MTVMIEDPRAAHQIRLVSDGAREGHAIVVTCTCLGTGRGHPSRGRIEARTLFPAADAIAAWRGWHADRGIEAAP